MTEATPEQGANVPIVPEKVNEDNLHDYLKQTITQKPSAEPAKTELKPEPEKDETEVISEVTPETDPGKDQKTDDTEVAEEPKDDAVKDKESTLTLQDLANVFGVDPNTLDVSDEGEPIFKMNIDGEETFAKASDLITSYQLKGHLNKNNMAVVEMRKTLEAERQSFQKDSRERLSKIDNTLTLLNNQLLNEFQGINWNKLEVENPARWAVLNQKYTKRQGQINNARVMIEQHRMSELSKLRDEQVKLLTDKLPELKDQKKFEALKTEVFEGAEKHYGFTPEEVSQVLDHRNILLIKDALAYRKLQENKPDSLKKVVKALKVVKPGTPKPALSKAEGLKKLRERVGKDISVSDFLLQSGISKVNR